MSKNEARASQRLSGIDCDSIQTVEQLEELLSEPTPGVVETLARLDGDIMVLGVAGKMGPTLARMARRASDLAGVKRRVIGVSRFSSGDVEEKLRSHGIETIRCDLLDGDRLMELPDAPNVIYMAGVKFGTTGRQSLTWAMNAFAPGMVCRKFHKSRIAAFSTGNVYPLIPVTLCGSLETDPPGPIGEYAMSCLGRERVFEHFSRTMGIPVTLIRLNYATELRYGVLVDIANKVKSGSAIDLANGNVNVIWQGDANAMALQSLGVADSPPFVLNVAGPEILSVRRIAEQLGRLMGKEVSFTGEESPDAYLSCGMLGHGLFGYPRVSVYRMLSWVADWVMRGGEELGKPTHFETRDGKY